MKLVSKFLILLILVSSCRENDEKRQNRHKTKLETEYDSAAVVTAHPLASQVGVDILKKGGNAVDAAVAVQFALAVVYPNAGNIGGGGFLVFRSNSGEVAALDFREKAPGAATTDMYLDSNNNAITELSLKGQLASGVPGSVAGMAEAHKKYGSLAWSQLLKPSIDLAEKGFQITAMQAGEFNRYKERFVEANPTGAAIIRNVDWKEGDIFRQPELSRVLKLIAEQGRDGFYKGKVAQLIVDEMKSGNGIISLKDLEDYKAIWRTPVHGKYRGHNIISMPPPSSGGPALIALLQSVESYPFSEWGFQSDSTVRAMVEAERRIYADRASHLGDPDFWDVPTMYLTDDSINKARMTKVDLTKATPSADVKAAVFPVKESEETTHFSIIDKDGNAVSLTTTLNGSYGSKVWVDGAGFLLNNEMDDFSVKPGVPNMFGLIGGEANKIEPNKRMLSSMTPTIVEKDGKLFMVVGTPGGSTIITSVFQTIINVIDFGMNAQESVSAARFHHQWLPDEIDVEEKAISPQVRKSLEKDGYVLKPRGNIGRVENIIVLPNGKLQAGADHRGDDVARGY